MNSKTRKRVYITVFQMNNPRIMKKRISITKSKGLRKPKVIRKPWYWVEDEQDIATLNYMKQANKDERFAAHMARVKLKKFPVAKINSD